MNKATIKWSPCELQSCNDCQALHCLSIYSTQYVQICMPVVFCWFIGLVFGVEIDIKHKMLDLGLLQVGYIVHFTVLHNNIANIE
jgi:hypothetical protein